MTNKKDDGELGFYLGLANSLASRGVLNLNSVLVDSFLIDFSINNVEKFIKEHDYAAEALSDEVLARYCKKKNLEKVRNENKNTFLTNFSVSNNNLSIIDMPYTTLQRVWCTKVIAEISRMDFDNKFLLDTKMDVIYHPEKYRFYETEECTYVIVPNEGNWKIIVS